VQRFAGEYQKNIVGLTPGSAWSSCAHYHYPGNIRELQNVPRAIGRARERPLIAPDDLDERVPVRALPEQAAEEES
jgi:transcriptional regulator with PAS, ATPase and Fis domain